MSSDRLIRVLMQTTLSRCSLARMTWLSLFINQCSGRLGRLRRSNRRLLFLRNRLRLFLFNGSSDFSICRFAAPASPPPLRSRLLFFFAHSNNFDLLGLHGGRRFRLFRLGDGKALIEVGRLFLNLLDNLNLGLTHRRKRNVIRTLLRLDRGLRQVTVF